MRKFAKSCKKLQKQRIYGNIRKNCRRCFLILFLLALSCQCICSISVNAKTVAMKFTVTNREGNVLKVKGKTIYFRRCTGSDPESWGKTQKAKLTSSTKYYELKEVSDDLKLKVSTKKKAMKSAKNSGNYNWFKIENGKVIFYIYMVEKFVG